MKIDPEMIIVISIPSSPPKKTAAAKCNYSHVRSQALGLPLSQSGWELEGGDNYREGSRGVYWPYHIFSDCILASHLLIILHMRAHNSLRPRPSFCDGYLESWTSGLCWAESILEGS